jgi:hypothetical protein
MYPVIWKMAMVSDTICDLKVTQSSSSIWPFFRRNLSFNQVRSLSVIFRTIVEVCPFPFRVRTWTKVVWVGVWIIVVTGGGAGTAGMET